MKNATDLLAENAFIELKEHLAERDTKLEDAHVLAISRDFGIDAVAGAVQYVKTYGGGSSFIYDLKGQLVRKGTLTVPQVRAALNVLQQEVKSGKVEVVRDTDSVKAVPMVAKQATGQPSRGEPKVACYTCGQKFYTMKEVMEHRAEEHAAAPVLKEEEGAERTFLDISGLPDGRYAASDPTGKNIYFYFSVRTVVKRHYRSKKYRYGKFHVGMEWIEPGTIEVRTWSQDAKKLVGQQKPGEGYQGEFTDQLIEVLEMPKLYARIFSRAIGVCSICGKTLTDDDSRNLGIGPECDKKYGDYWKQFNRAKKVAAASEEEDHDHAADDDSEA